MSDSAKAVFLSYASQDAEAAKRICDALRAAGVEVWFDQNELVGGDAWDAKIRKQIQSCALFVPIISAATQARGEGYFRLEWKLAVDRSHLMADDAPFLFPVVIDDTIDAAARVPDKFREVQWTRLNVKDTPESLAARVGRLLARADGTEIDEAQDSEERRPGRKRERRPAWLRYTMSLAGLAIGLAYAIKGVWQPVRPDPDVPAAVTSSAPSQGGANAVSVLSEARQLVAKAWVQINRPDVERAELQTADELCHRAAALDPTDPDVWATWSYVDSWYCYHSLDNSPERREGARVKAARAMQLAPTSFDARLAQANYLVREGSDASVSLYAPEADRLLRALLLERPTDPRALLTFAILQRNLGHAPEARQALATMAKDPAFAALAWHEHAWVELRLGSPATALELEERSIALQPFSKNLTAKMNLLMNWQGDLDAAKVVLEQMPAAAMQEDYTIAVALRLLFLRREPDALQRLVRSIPRDWLESNMYRGPLGWWAGLAEQQAQRPEAARVYWQAALKLVERRLADAPAAADLIAWKGQLLAVLGETVASDKALRLAREMGSKSYSIAWEYDDALNGHTERVLDELEAGLAKAPDRIWAASLRLDPFYDPLRGNPRFTALQARVDADPRCSPTAKAAQK